MSEPNHRETQGERNAALQHFVPPADLPRTPRLFWSVHPSFESLNLDETPEVDSALEKLGSPPFPRSGFPFAGFLATVYDHVASHVCPPEDE